MNPPAKSKLVSALYKGVDRSRVFSGLSFNMLSSEEAVYLSLAFLLLYLLFPLLSHLQKITKTKVRIKEWPILGMTPGLIWNNGRLHDRLTEAIDGNNGTFLFKGPVLANMDILFTSDPANVHYILTKNFDNFGKGPEFKKIFDVLGDGIFAAEGKSWEDQRKLGKIFMGNSKFHCFGARLFWEKTGNVLIPILEASSTTRKTLDLPKLFTLLAFDTTVHMILGNDPKLLENHTKTFPEVKAFHDIEEAAFYRHIIPEKIWMTMSRLRIGREKRMIEGKKVIHEFMEKCIGLREEQLRVNPSDYEQDYDMLGCYIRAASEKSLGINISKQVWRDATLNFLVAGKDSITTALSWLFWLLANNPEKEEKLRQEISANSGNGKWTFTDVEDLKKLIYLNGAIYETLRLYPPVALNHKSPVEADILPSGHHVKPNSKIVTSFYSMARLESVWGKDCREFKPERWITDRGMLVFVPSYKFTAFNAGPRTCLGKEIALTQLKIAAAAVVSRYKITVLDDVPVFPGASVLLHMKHGMKVKISKCE